MKFPWKLAVTSILVSIVLRPLFDNDLDYVIACLVAGALLGYLEAKFKLGLM